MNQPVIDLSAVLAYARAQNDASLAELDAFLRIPSVSTQREHDSDTRAAAAWLATAMRDAGLENVRLFETPRHPLVYGDWLHAGPDAPTVLIYGHYDVQPPDPLEEWQSPPSRQRAGATTCTRVGRATTRGRRTFT